MLIKKQYTRLTENLCQTEGAWMVLILKEVKESISNFSPVVNKILITKVMCHWKDLLR